MNKFVTKLQTNGYRIGSFEAFLEENLNLISSMLDMNMDDAEKYFKEMPIDFRASIVDPNGKYAGFIGIRNVNEKSESADISLEVIDTVSLKDKQEILDCYKKYLMGSININYFDSKKKKDKPTIIKSKYIKPDIDEKTLKKYKEMYPDMPNLYLPATLSMGGIVFGIIGLSNVVRTNKRADLEIYLNKELVSFDSEFISELIDDYISFAHKDNIWNVSYKVGANNKKMIDVFNESDMAYYGTIPFADIDGDMIGNLMMYQHTPHMLVDLLPTKSEIYVSKNIFNTEKKEMANSIELDNGYRMVKSDMIDEKMFTNLLSEYADRMSNRKEFTIPFDCDKYFPEIGDSGFGLYKKMKNSSYVVLNEYGAFSGFAGILNEDSDKKHCDIEVVLIPSIQKKDVALDVIEKFYDELFSVGYASVTSKVYNSKTGLNRTFQKTAEISGCRIQSYYVNGILTDINIYTKLNPLVSGVKIK